MLILTRRPNQSIHIGNSNEIIIKILYVKGELVGIGIQAPRDMPIRCEDALASNHDATNLYRTRTVFKK